MRHNSTSLDFEVKLVKIQDLSKCLKTELALAQSSVFVLVLIDYLILLGILN
jgi:hypothetical protein